MSNTNLINYEVLDEIVEVSVSVHQELIDLWRNTSKEPSFIKWLDKKQEGCKACGDKPCKRPWCPFTEGEE